MNLATIDIFKVVGILLSSQGSVQPVDFSRTYASGLESRYSVRFQLEGMSVGAKCKVRETVKSFAPDRGAKVKLDVLEQESLGGDLPPKPEPVFSNVSGHNMADAIKMTLGQIDFVYLFLASAGATADKNVILGDTFPVKWHSAKQDLTLDGTGKILEITARSIKVQLKQKLTVDGQDFGGFTWTSIHELADQRLKSATGTFELQGIKYDLSIDRSESAAK